MAIVVSDLIDRSAEPWSSQGLDAWKREVFLRAYCGPKGPFTRVCDRLRNGFSVLVYLPGNCVGAAAEHVKRELGAQRCSEWGRYSPTYTSLSDVWAEARSVTGTLLAWLSGQEEGRQHALFHNLDLLSDGRGGVHTQDAALLALFSLVEATRTGIVLGLVDRDAGALPARVESVFPEVERIEEIPFDRFPGIIPRSLGERLQDSAGHVPEGVAWLVASRLRWTDPLHAVQIMENAAEAQGSSATDYVTAIWRMTRSVRMIGPDEAFPGDPDAIKGVSTQYTLDRLRESVVAPFRRWAQFTGTPEECEAELKRLPPGLILWGPSGTGKTFLARWLARQIDLPVRLATGDEIKAGPWGDAERNVQRLFAEARRAAPCLLVLDDADDLLLRRGEATGALASAESSVVAALLRELEGFSGRSSGVLVVVTTNRFRALDPAIKTKLWYHIGVPYPLTKDQVGEVVDVMAQECGLTVSADIRSQLVERFWKPVIQGVQLQGWDQLERRRTLGEGLFSPREIRACMQLLRAGASGTATIHSVTDLKPMNEYLDQQLPPPDKP
jgi:hypothetical protein